MDSDHLRPTGLIRENQSGPPGITYKISYGQLLLGLENKMLSCGWVDIR